MKIKSVIRWLSIFITASLLLSLVPCAFAADAVPTLMLDAIPEYGVSGQITGSVLNGTRNLAVTAYLQVSDGGKIWGPKPTLEDPSVPVSADGSFSLRFITGGTDIDAVMIYIYLIPADYLPSTDDTATEAYALDKLVVSRDEDGAVTVLPREGKWLREDTGTESAEVPADTEVSGIKANPYTGNSSISICYSPYTNNQNPEKGDALPLEQLEWQLNILHPYADTIRTFGVSGEMLKLYQEAKEIYGYRIIAGCWISAGYSDEQIKQELDALIGIANNGWCDVAVVGSECLYRGDFTQEQITNYIKYVKDGINDKSIPVTTSDTAGSMLSAASLAEQCDVIMVTYYPFFEGQSIKNATATLKAMYERLKEKYPDKEIIISETGWPSDGSAEGAAVPSEANAAEYFKEVYAWSEAENIEVVYFSAFDEGWKVEGSFGDIGTHWGHFTSSGVLKESYRGVYNSINSDPLSDVSDSWAENEIMEMVKAGYVSPDGPGIYDPKIEITRGDFIHYLMNALAPDITFDPSIDGNFSDVDPMLYYAETIGIGRKMGIVAGTGNDECRPKTSITRQEEFTLIYRAMLKTGAIEPATDADRKALTGFKDSGDISTFATDAFAALIREGMIKGSPDKKLSPLSFGTRAEAAVLICRINSL